MAWLKTFGIGLLLLASNAEAAVGTQQLSYLMALPSASSEGQPEQPLTPADFSNFDVAFVVPTQRLSAIDRFRRQGTITGQVRDVATDRLIGAAQVSVSELDRGVLTQSDGTYFIPDVPPGSYQVTVSMIGYSTVQQNVTVISGETSVLDFNLRTTAISLEGVVVTGIGVQEERRRLGYASASIGSAEIERRPVQNITQVLRGQIPGVMPAAAVGETGAAAPTRLRGQTSLSQRNEPLLIIDGVRQDGSLTEFTRGNMATSRLDEINPADIERIEVIKGAAAATLFGTEASSGVIQVFTKQGLEGPARYSFSIDEGASTIPLGTIPPNRAYNPDTRSFVEQHPTRDIVRTGHIQNYNLSLSGGTPDFNYYASGRLFHNSGNSPQARERNVSLRTRFELRHGEKLRTDLGLYVIRRTIRTAPSALNIGPTGIHVFGNPLFADTAAGRPYGESLVSYADLTRGGMDQSLVDRHSIDFTATYQWTPNLTSQLVVGYSQVGQERGETIELGQGNIAGGTVTGRRDLRKSRDSQLTVDFNSAWGGRLTDDFGLQLWGGGQAYFEERTGSRILGLDFPAPGLRTISAAGRLTDMSEEISEVVSAGLFTQAQIDFQDRAFLTAGLRADGNSTFGDELGLTLYPKVSGSYVLSDEAFWPGGGKWSLLRLRAAYGQSGLQPGAFDAVTTWEPLQRIGRAVLWPGNLGNPELKPERSTELEMGADIGLFDDRLGMEFTYYSQRTTDGIVALPRPPSQGFTSAQVVNLGEIKGHGYEALLIWNVMQRAGFDWSMTASGSLTRQTVVSIGRGDTDAYVLPGHRARAYVAEGQAPGTFRTTVLDEANPYSLTVGSIEELTRLDQIVANPLKNAAGGDSLVFHKPGLPPYTGTISTDIGFQRFRLRALFSGAAGFSLHDEAGVITYQNGVRPDASQLIAELDNPSTTPERRAEIAREHAGKSNTIWGNWVQDGDYLRFQELSLMYRVSEAIAGRLGLNSLTVTLSGQNLALWSKADSWADPGSTGGHNQSPLPIVTAIHRMSLPVPRTYTLSFQGGW